MAISLFDQKSEDELWIEYRKKRSPQIRDAFIRQYMPLVKYVAGKVSVGMPGSVEFDDLVGYGQFGLLDAIEKLEKKIAEIEAKKAELENKMAQPEVYSNGEKAKAVQREIEEVSNKLEETNLAWMEKAELLG